MKGRRLSGVVIAVVLVVLAIYFIFPFYWLTIGTTKSVS
ncbi:MAG: carbohydrate ABC transporter permease, partial [Firmicutes bacterium]|nr:carbohydrate ABC transporter permease [Bacillota bacterium]